MSRTPHALLIGASDYERFPMVRFGSKDARDVRDALFDAGYDKANVWLVADGETVEPRYIEIINALAELASRLSTEDTVLLFFSGHGIRDGDDDYLLPIDASLQALRKSAFRLADIIKDLRDAGSEQVVVLIDAGRNELSAAKGRADFGSRTQDFVQRTDGVAAFLSSEPHEMSYEIEALENGAFTRALVEAIAEPGITTVEETYEYLLRAIPVLNEMHRGRLQHPQLIVNPDSLLKLQLWDPTNAKSASGSVFAQERSVAGSGGDKVLKEGPRFVQGPRQLISSAPLSTSVAPEAPDATEETLRGEAEDEAIALKIFLSYRREDTEGDAGRLYDALAGAFGADAIYKDVDDVPWGADWKRSVRDAVEKSTAMIVMVGPAWELSDALRLELDTAFASNITILPILVRGATMPLEESLPGPLREFADLNAAPLDHATWGRHVQPLIAELRGLATSRQPRDTGPDARRPN